MRRRTGRWLTIIALAACDRAANTPPATPAPPVSSDAAALLRRADSLYARDFDSARVAYDSAIADARRHGDSLTLARALTSRGNAAWRLGRYDEAERIGHLALALKLRLRLARELPKSYAGLGLLAQARGRLEEAELLLRNALDASIAAGDSTYLAKSHNNFGLLLTDLGEFDRARTELGAARTIAAARHDVIVETSAAINLGKLELELGAPRAALRWLSGARTRSAELRYFVGEENALGQMARAHAVLGERTVAISHLESALALARMHKLKEPEADDLHLMAELYQHAGQYRLSLQFLAQARALSDSLDMTTKLAHVSLAEARAYVALRNLPAALARSTALVERLRVEGARGDLLDAQLYAAEIAQRMGRPAEAQARLDTAFAITRDLGTGVARLQLALARARVLEERGAPRAVVEVLSRLGADTVLLTADEQTDADGMLAAAYLRLGALDSAVGAGRRAVDGLERIRARMASGEFRSGYTTDRIGRYANLVMALLRRGNLDEAFRVADAARNRTLTERLGAESRAVRSAPGSSTAELRRLLARIDLLTARLRSRDSARSRDRSSDMNEHSPDLVRQLAEARREYEAIRARTAIDEPATAILGAGAMSLRHVRRSLNSGEALIEFLATSDRLVTFVVRRDTVQWEDRRLGRDELAERVRSTRAVIAGRNADGDAPMRGLFELLISPLERRYMLDGVRSLVIVPHGALTYLPFAALVRADPAGSRYLVEDYSLVALASASALPALRARIVVSEPTKLDVFAPIPSELPASRAEASTVATTSHAARQWVGSRATEGVLRQALAGTGVVHVATHGLYNARSPMFAGIRLASTTSPHEPDDDGRLETHEVLSMTVRSPLVFLSGCETALGPAWTTTFEPSDDYVTLAQAFLFAGAQNVVATLWPIDDGSAADLAGRFSRALASSPPAEALAHAQRDLIRGGRYRHPYYWAAYVLSGSGVLR